LGVRALYEALSSSQRPATASALAEWGAIFRVTCGADWPGRAERIEPLAKTYGLATHGWSPESLLFAVQTWYALVVKLLVGQAVAGVRGVESPTRRIWTASAGQAVRRETAELESGGLFQRLGVADPGPSGPLAWYAAEWSEAIEQAVVRLAAELLPWEPAGLGAAQRGERDPFSGQRDLLNGQRDPLKPLYQSMFPRSVRHALGEYYTPDWLADHVLDQAGYQGEPQSRLLDPACGSGTFLLAAIGRLRARLGSGDERGCRKILDQVVGLDLHPLAVLTARANYLLAIADLLPPDEVVAIPVYQCDSILGERAEDAETRRRARAETAEVAPVAASPCPRVPASFVPAGGFDYVVGNPPWIAWDNLPVEYRQASKPLWERYGLFSLSGREARHGGGKKDLSMLMLYVSADRYLRSGGRLGMVVTQTVFQTKGAGDGFRRFRLGADGPWLRVLRVDDFVSTRPFDAANWTSSIVLEKGEPTEYPVRYVKWLPCGVSPGRPEACLARPIEPARRSSPWLVWPASWPDDPGRLVGRADYTAHLGANSGGANAVYWLEVLGSAAHGVRVRNLAGSGRGGVEAVETVIESDLLYPLVRWGDVDRYCARPSAHLLLVQDVVTRAGLDEAVFRQSYPRAYAYLKRFEGVLTRRAAYRRYQERQAFYSMYNVGAYTLWPVKVVWRRMDRQVRAAVLEAIDDPLLGRRPVVPQETCVLVACHSTDEAHYLCGLLNSSLVHFLVAAYSVAGGKGFGAPGMLDFLPIGRFNPGDERHLALAALSRQAHRAALGPGIDPAAGPSPRKRASSFLSPENADELKAVQARADRLAAELLGRGALDVAASGTVGPSNHVFRTAGQASSGTRGGGQIPGP
jgi:hypothetical protein